MIKMLRGLFGAKAPAAPAAQFVATAPNEIFIDGAQPFPLAQHITRDQGFPRVDWDAADAWLDSMPEERRNEAWNACVRGWLLHLAAALGPQYQLVESASAYVLSSLDDNVARASLEFIGRTQARIARVLEDIAQPDFAKCTLVVFDDDDSYYRYVSMYHAEGEHATSGGMYLGGGHFVTTKSDLRAIEPVITHEMTHATVARLPLPSWVNEGLAVNTEFRLHGHRPRYTPEQMHERHRAFWNAQRIQALWSGAAYDTPGDMQELGYDLARVIIEQMAKDWPGFKAFVLAANADDGGAAAAREHLGVDLGQYACALLEHRWTPAWSPDPAAWAK